MSGTEAGVVEISWAKGPGTLWCCDPALPSLIWGVRHHFCCCFLCYEGQCPTVKIRVFSFFYLEVQQDTVLPGQLTIPGHEDLGKHVQHLITILLRFPARVLSLLTHAGMAQDLAFDLVTFTQRVTHIMCNYKRSQDTNTTCCKKS